MTYANNSTTLHHTNEKSLIVYICIHFIMPWAVAIGIIGNLLSILVFARREMIKFCVSIFTIVLAVSDILLLTTSLFNIILPDYLSISLSDQSTFWCHFHGYFDLLFAALSGYSVVFISVERWFSIWKPFKKAQYVTFKATKITVISYILISVIFFLWFPLTLHYNPNASKSVETCRLSRPIAYKVFGTISVIFTYIVPFFFLGILNTLIAYRLHVRQNTSIQRSLMQSANIIGVDATLSARKRLQRQRNTDRNITFMLITVAIAFMVMTFPFQIYWFYMQIRQLIVPDSFLFTLTQTFRYLNCCCNFFLYSATSSLFRRELSEIFNCTNSLNTNLKITNNDNDYKRRSLLAVPLGSIDHTNISPERNSLISPMLSQTPSKTN
ncbi:unnamed protein product [Rotaria magnacalcarata]|uniref:G-protein coupled receptors family 1 profile domain-containing protein n=2 Tax=Rotaria magnacalcarata TaxID=392030 RepID=A0A816WQV2_9BILA|nr:unnamed protein product [Rotaria magnacalcarata]CAF1494073.1 unnamed protein product [Rotaria magnacalcarata]CAF2130734.1 unnamed protein product [Rotaria magnacalcarata]CAF2137311.1 unnamed protein product [Rotaria magnacalcarata]CAF4052679.1 unnamed protein product [Rotaria magnacalcarata]